MDKDKTGLLVAFSVGLILSDLIPTPADALYFYLQRKNKDKLEAGEITPKQYWIRDAAGYYGLNPIWWVSITAASLTLGKSYTQKRNILIGLIAGGVVVGVLNKNIKADTVKLQENGKIL